MRKVRGFSKLIGLAAGVDRLRYCPVLATEPEGGRSHRGLHVQPRRVAVSDVDAATVGKPEGLGSRWAGVAPMGLWRRKGTAGSDNQAARRN